MDTFKAQFIICLLRILACLPLRFNHALGKILGYGLLWLPNTIKQVTRTNIDLCYPEKTARWRNQLLQQSLIETGKTFTELGPLWFWHKDRLLKKVVSVSGKDIFKEPLPNHTGIIAVTPHMGCWELASFYISQTSPLTNLFRPPRLETLTPTIYKARERFGAHLVPINTQGIKAIYQALRTNEVVGLLPDQEPSKNHGVFAPFFGINAYTMLLLPRLAQKTGARIIFVYMERLARGKGYHLHYVPTDDEIYAKDPRQSATAINRIVESCIDINPAQYMWGYKRFKKRPDGEDRFY